MAPVRHTDKRTGNQEINFTGVLTVKSPKHPTRKPSKPRPRNNNDRKHDPRDYPVQNINLNSTPTNEFTYEIMYQDEVFLGIGGLLLSKLEFAQAMQLLEDKSYFKIQRYTPDVVFCATCTQVEGDSDIILCDLCNVAVHINCYGVPFVPDNQWLCRKCELHPTGHVHCALCLKTGGAFKTTVHRAYPWVHVACAFFHPQVSLLNESCKEPASFKLNILTAKNNPCVICKKSGGACIKCSHKWCRRGAFHVSCALETKGFCVDEGKIYCECEQHQPQGGIVMDGTCDVYAQKPLVFPSVKQSTRDKLREIFSSRSRIEVDYLVAKIERYWMLKKISNHGLPLNSGSNLPLKIEVDEIEEPVEENSVMEFEDIRNEVIHTRNLLENVNAAVDEIVHSPNALENAMEAFKRQVQPPSLRTFMELLLNVICSWDVNRYFAQPVDSNVVVNVDNYNRMILRPMDLGTMRQRLFIYWSVEHVEADFTLMVNNCIRFNSPETVYAIEAERLRLLSIPFFQQAKVMFQQLRF